MPLNLDNGIIVGFNIYQAVVLNKILHAAALKVLVTVFLGGHVRHSSCWIFASESDNNRVITIFVEWSNKFTKKLMGGARRPILLLTRQCISPHVYGLKATITEHNIIRTYSSRSYSQQLLSISLSENLSREISTWTSKKSKLLLYSFYDYKARFLIME